MLIYLPLISFVLFLAATHRFTTGERSLRNSFLIASLLWAASITVSAELLSISSSFTAAGLAFFWLIVIVVTLISMFKFKSYEATLAKETPKPWTIVDSTLIIGIVVIVIATGVTAFVAPPNNWDSMTYHMSRVTHWVQNKSVEFYPTSMPRQLWASPWTEYAIAQLQILSHSDRMANMVQWFCMVGSILGVSLIAKMLGAARRGQIVSAVLCASLPVGILEASSTQNDYAAAFWCLCAVYFGLKLREAPRRSTAIWYATSLGLALLTKATTPLFLAPFLFWITLAGIQKHHRKFLPVIALLACLPLMINAPQFIRNYQLSGNILSLPSESKSVTNETHNMHAVISNALRYIGLNLCTSDDKMNQRIAAIITETHHRLGWNIVDPKYTLGEEYKIKQDIHEDNSCNTAFTILFFILTIAFLISHRQIHCTQIKAYLASLIGAFFIFCLLLKWQPWGNRLLLPLFILAIPFLSAVLDKKYPRLSILVAITAMALCLPWITSNRSRPLINKEFTIFNKNRSEQYFSNIPGEYFSYQRAADETLQSGCKDIALVMTSESWEYPLWPLLGAPKTKGLRIEHVNINNPSGKFNYPLGSFDPCIAIHDTAQGIAKILINDVGYVKTNQFTYLSIYRKDVDGTIARSVRNAHFSQMIQYAMESDQILEQAQNRGGINQPALLESFRLRRLAIDHAGLLDPKELDTIYNNLGTSIGELFVKGSNLLLEGLSSQDPVKINQGQNLLNQWNIWFAKNIKDLQAIFQ